MSYELIVRQLRHMAEELELGDAEQYQAEPIIELLRTAATSIEQQHKRLEAVGKHIVDGYIALINQGR